MTDQYSTTQSQPSGGGAGKVVFIALLLVVAGIAYFAFTLVGSNGNDAAAEKPPAATPQATGPQNNTRASDNSPAKPANRVVVNIAYGTEKERWLKWAVQEWEKTDAGRRVSINLVPRGSVEGARDVINGPGETPIQVWSPASSAYRDTFESEWSLRHSGGSPILREENLALSPMVFVFWKERHDAFISKYKQVTFDTLLEAMTADGGWGTIADHDDWGLFKFSHTDPNRSNSGLLSLVLLAYNFHQKQADLTVGDVVAPQFQTWMTRFESAVARPSGELSHSTGTVMKDMVLRGPSQYDALLVYENLAIDYLKAAQGRWGQLYVVYPQINMWNENPYYLLDVPWSSPEQRAGAGEFLDFLMSEPVQRKALEHGFRPGNPIVPVVGFPESPFERFKVNGLKTNLSTLCQPPKAEVLSNLMGSFNRITR